MNVFELEDKEAVVAAAELVEICMDLFNNEKARTEMSKDVGKGISYLIKTKPETITRLCSLYLCQDKSVPIKLKDIIKVFKELLNNEDFKELLGL